MKSHSNSLHLVAPCDFEQRTASNWKTKVLGSVGSDVTLIEIDLAGTRNIDSNGLSALLALNETMRKASGQVRLINPSSPVTQLLELTSLHRVFVITRGASIDSGDSVRPILIVEDEAIIRSVAEMSLKPLGRPIIFAENGQQAIGIARSDQPAVILLDYLMPLMDGTEALRRLKSDDTTRHIPVIIMSANEKIAAGVYESFEGASCFVSKPFSPTSLRGEVHRLIQESLEVAA